MGSVAASGSDLGAGVVYPLPRIGSKKRYGKPVVECWMGCGAAASDRQEQHLACPLLRDFALRTLLGVTTADARRGGPLATQVALYIDIALRSYNTRRQGSTLLATSLLAARTKEAAQAWCDWRRCMVPSVMAGARGAVIVFFAAAARS